MALGLYWWSLRQSRGARVVRRFIYSGTFYSTLFKSNSNTYYFFTKNIKSLSSHLKATPLVIPQRSGTVVKFQLISLNSCLPTIQPSSLLIYSGHIITFCCGRCRYSTIWRLCCVTFHRSPAFLSSLDYSTTFRTSLTTCVVKPNHVR